jgi:hypothetical protein
MVRAGSFYRHFPIRWSNIVGEVWVFRREFKSLLNSISSSVGLIDSMRPAGWTRKFNEPTPLPKGKPLTTLRDAALYITKLPKAEHDAPEWQAAMEALLLVAEHGGPTMLARIGVMRALNRHVESDFQTGAQEKTNIVPHISLVFSLRDFMSYQCT